MNFSAFYVTDVGIVKKINQDSLCIKRAQTESGEIIMAVLCDGMGGLSDGELASSSVVLDYSDWLSDWLRHLQNSQDLERIREQWERLIQNVNSRIYKYGKDNCVQLGTTLTTIMILPDGQYIIGHVGDTRAYLINNRTILQLTEDQTFVAREIKAGRMTAEEAKTDKRKNVLLQCVGGEKMVNPTYYVGKINEGENILLCSDGFRHVLEESEIQHAVLDSVNSRSEQATLSSLVETNKQRGERDNISVILIES